MEDSFVERAVRTSRRLARPQSYTGLLEKPVDRLKWKAIDRKIRDYMSHTACMQVLQIGANDGLHADPINHYIREFGWGGVLVEPIPAQFERLQETYRDNRNLRFVNAAITDFDGVVDMYTPKDQQGALQGKDSVHLDVLEKHAWMVQGDLSEQIERMAVPAMTLDTLLGKTGLQAIDFLAIDTEGNDKVIMDQVDLDTLNPHFVMFEHCHLSAPDRDQLRHHLEGSGYATTRLRRDIFAYQVED